jgi:hypothetical protein
MTNTHLFQIGQAFDNLLDYILGFLLGEGSLFDIAAESAFLAYFHDYIDVGISSEAIVVLDQVRARFLLHFSCELTHH